jgi:hypothetical protein
LTAACHARNGTRPGAVAPPVFLPNVYLKVEDCAAQKRLEGLIGNLPSRIADAGNEPTKSRSVWPARTPVGHQ